MAATLVAGFHLQQASLAEGGDPGFFKLFAGGEIGVDIFFVISGFIIFYIARNRANLTRRGFITARFWRIYPPYWVVLTLYILAGIALAVMLGDRSKLPSGGSVFISYFLLPYPDHVIVIAWTLSVEILFYAVFAVSFFGSGGGRRLVFMMILWVVATQIFSKLVTEKPQWLVFVLNSIVLEFLFGIFIAMVFMKQSQGEVLKFRLPALILGGFGVLYCLLSGALEAGPFGREIVAGVPSALLVYGALGFSVRNMDKLEVWGESSYILYLVHILYFSISSKVVEILFSQNVYHSQAWMLLLLFSVILISYMATVWLERPYQIWYRKFLGR